MLVCIGARCTVTHIWEFVKGIIGTLKMSVVIVKKIYMQQTLNPWMKHSKSVRGILTDMDVFDSPHLKHWGKSNNTIYK